MPHDSSSPIDCVPALRTVSSGRASHSIEFLHDAPLPKSIEEQLLADLREKKAENR